jgi:hypothetical protein
MDSFVTLLNLVFAAICFVSAWRALRRGLPFIRLGWQAIDAAVQRPDYRSNVESRRTISEGGNFLIGGLLWLLIGLLGAGIGVFFAAQAINPPVEPVDLPTP